MTVTAKLLLAVALPSLTVTVMVAVPTCAGAGVTATVRLAPLPPKTMLAFGTNDGLDELPLNARLLNAVSTSPTVKPIGPVVPPEKIVWFAILEIVGGSFSEVTVRVKLPLTVNAPSLTVTVIVAVPD